MINEIKPPAREHYDRGQQWEKENRKAIFERFLRVKPPYPDMPEIPLASNASFENPTFNILTGNTNYVLRDMASDRRGGNTPQMELFDRRSGRNPIKSAD